MQMQMQMWVWIQCRCIIHAHLTLEPLMLTTISRRCAALGRGIGLASTTLSAMTSSGSTRCGSCSTALNGLRFELGLRLARLGLRVGVKTGLRLGLRLGIRLELGPIYAALSAASLLERAATR